MSVNTPYLERVAVRAGYGMAIELTLSVEVQRKR